MHLCAHVTRVPDAWSCGLGTDLAQAVCVLLTRPSRKVGSSPSRNCARRRHRCHRASSSSPERHPGRLTEWFVLASSSVKETRDAMLLVRDATLLLRLLVRFRRYLATRAGGPKSHAPCSIVSCTDLGDEEGGAHYRHTRKKINTPSPLHTRTHTQTHTRTHAHAKFTWLRPQWRRRRCRPACPATPGPRHAPRPPGLVW